MAENLSANFFGTTSQITSRYTDLQSLVRDSFSWICSAKDQSTEQAVAVKKVIRPFSTPATSKRTYGELKLLEHLRHENVIALSNVFISPLDEIYFVTDMLAGDLHRRLQQRPLEKQIIQYLTYQILRGLKYIHSVGIIHKDLKPSKILLNEDWDVKICGFDLESMQDSRITDNATNQYYRAPEVMATWPTYDAEVDIWSAGCIFAEMLQSKPLFPGKDSINQFCIITELLGNPPQHLIDTIRSENTLRFVQSLPKRQKQPLTDKFKNADPLAIDLLETMLVFDPQTRVSASQALTHEYLAPYRDSVDELVADEKFDWSFSDTDLPVESWKARLYSEISDCQVMLKRA